jgi:uncharacterized protein (TIGR03435 family)
MMRFCLSVLLVSFQTAMALAQAAADSLKFEVADVHSSPHITQPVVRGPFTSSDRYELRFATMLDLIRIAYNVDPERVSGGPSWLEMDRFDVLAKPPSGSGSGAEVRRQMLQALLAERFDLAIHNDSRPVPAYALTVAKGGKLKEADGAGESGCNFVVQNAPPPGPPGGGPITLPVIAYTCKNTTMEAFAAGMLSFAGAGQYFNNRLVVDRTDLKGTWDFSFRFTPKIPAGIPATGESIPLFEALEQQLGLKLDAATVPMPTIVVDRVNRKPTENSAEAMKKFPALPMEFEVASLKPVAPDAPRGPGGPRPDIKNGRLYLPGISLKNLISVAWDVNGDDLLVNMPKWAEDDRYDINAKAPASVALGNLSPDRNGIPVNIDALRPMIRSLLIERFKLAAHTENRPVTAYTLLAPKPKLKKADPTSRTRWQEGVMPDAKANKNANASLGRLVTCQNVSMAQFAELLPRIAPGYLHTEVIDATGLEGGWDFTFSFSPMGVLQMNRKPAENAANGEASDPTEALSLFDALNRQLGLKLETQKRPISVLVIDHIERTPIEN